jgi:antitoxin VapB
MERYHLHGGEVDALDLSIKNEEAHRLAQELAALTGENMAVAVTEALRERLERVRRERSGDLATCLLAIGKDYAARLREPWRSADVNDLIYDERGLPLPAASIPRSGA